MRRILTTSAISVVLATSAIAQNATIPTFGAQPAPSGGATIPSFGSTATPPPQAAIPSFGTTAPAAPTGTIPPFGAAPAGTPAAAPAPSSGNVFANDPQRIMTMMQEFGYLTTLGTDSVGDPQISSQVSDTNFNVYFYGCTDGRSCTNIQFAAGYDLANGTTAQIVNEWNASKRFAYAYIDAENDPFLNMDINLDFDGIGPDNLRDFFDLWRTQVEAFEDHINW